MATTDSVDIKISQDLIKPIIDAKIHAAIVDALGDGKAVVEKMVDVFLKTRVDKDGNLPRYSGDTSYSRMDLIAQKMVTEAIQDALKEWASENKEMIKTTIANYFKTKKGTSQIVDAINSGIIESISQNYRMTVQIGKTN